MEGAEFRLSYNGLTTLPKAIGQLTNLQQLDLDRNQLTTLPETIGQLTNLHQLDLTSNRLTVLPESIGQLTSLFKLGLSDNRLKILPETIDRLTNLEALGLSHNQLTALLETIGQLTNLHQFDLDHNQLATLPKTIGQLTNLPKLDLRNNQLTTLPETIGQLTNLHQLDLDYNQLTTLPEAIGQLTNLPMLGLSDNRLTTLPETIGRLINLEVLGLSHNQLTTLPETIGQLTDLQHLVLSHNQLTMLSEIIGDLKNLQVLYLQGNRLMTLPETIGQLTNLHRLYLQDNQLTTLPETFGQLTGLQHLVLSHNQLTMLSEIIGDLKNLQVLYLQDNQLMILPETIGQLTNLHRLYLQGNRLRTLPESIGQLTNLERLYLQDNQLMTLPETIGQLTSLERLILFNNRLTTLPNSVAWLEKLIELDLRDNPFNLTLRGAYNAGLNELRAYLHSLKDAEPLYEAKLVLVGEGGVGKTTLLKALRGQETRKDEPTTHGAKIDINALRLSHPDKAGVKIQFNSWDFGGQKVYRVTHQFFFSRNAVYLLVWEPRSGVERGLIEEWLKLIRLRVGDEARVIIVSTHSRTIKRLARIDEPVLRRDYGDMIIGFHEVDSIVVDKVTGDKIGLSALRDTIAEAAKELEQMGLPFNVHWRKARDELLVLGETQPHISYGTFDKVCRQHGLSEIEARTLAALMHELGYIVYYGDDEALEGDVVLQPEWLTKTIGFVLEDQITAQMDGILPDSRLRAIWYENPLDEEETRFEPELYPFFLRLMERFDVSYRLETGDASLVAQHVPQVRPSLPWLPEETPQPGQRRLALACVMDEEPPGLVPWMIVRTHDYAYETRSPDGQAHRLHWQKGMFLHNAHHGEAMLELIGREFRLQAEAVWPDYFMTKLQQILQKLITDNWPGLKGRYYFAVPCPANDNGTSCTGRFDISALRQFLDEGDATIRCQVCRTRQNIVELLYGFEEEDTRSQLARIERKVDEGFTETHQVLAELNSRLANYVMAILHALANEAKAGPRLFVVLPSDEWYPLNPRQLANRRYQLYIWCEAEDEMHPVADYYPDQGVYEFEATKEWLTRVAPYANFIAGVLKSVLPLVGPAVHTFFDGQAFDASDWKARLDLSKAASGSLLPEIAGHEPGRVRRGMLEEVERSGVLALHSFLREHDPNHERLGLRRMPTPAGDYLWLCEKHYEAVRSKIPERIGDF